MNSGFLDFLWTEKHNKIDFKIPFMFSASTSTQTLECYISIIKSNTSNSLLWTLNGPQREKTCLRGFASNTGADQPAHPRSLISAFVIRFW